MKTSLTVLLFFIINLSTTIKVFAKEVAVVVIEAEIYSIPISKNVESLASQLQSATLEESPVIIVEVGSEATIEVRAKSIGIGEDIISSLHLQFDQAGEYFDVDFKLQNKENNSISKLENNPLNSSFIISASIDNSTQLVKIKTKIFVNKTFALASMLTTKPTEISLTKLTQMKKELAQEVALCYVAHRGINTDLYKSYDTDKYKELIADLIGADKVNREILIADRTIRGKRIYNKAMLTNNIARRYCSNIDKKLTSILQNSDKN